MKVLFSLILLTSLFSDRTASDKSVSILFVGNSLTYINNLPALVKEKAKEHRIKVKTDVLAFPAYALEDHWNDGELQKRISSKKYQYVVAQQGPSSQADGRAMLLDYGKRIKKLCDVNNSQLAFFMVWPARVNSETFEGVITNYTDAAQTTGSLLCPVGKIWLDHFIETQDYNYYGPDGFHPSEEGSRVAANVIFESLSLTEN
jgi:hypothetical protein